MFTEGENYLVIPDTHIPFEHPDALKFLIRVKKFFKIKDEHCIHLGDELDIYFLNMYSKDPNSTMTARQEIAASRDKIKQWSEHFQELMLCHSNHISRIWRKASFAEIPSEMLRTYKEFIGAPEGWRWKDEWHIKTKHSEFLATHGEGFSGPMGHRSAAITYGISTVIGHLHSGAAISRIDTKHQKIWACNSGCLIDNQQFVFHYAAHAKNKPSLGCTVILDSGRTPIWIPMI
jgi:hypothetical protein